MLEPTTIGRTPKDGSEKSGAQNVPVANSRKLTPWTVWTSRKKEIAAGKREATIPAVVRIAMVALPRRNCRMAHSPGRRVGSCRPC